MSLMLQKDKLEWLSAKYFQNIFSKTRDCSNEAPYRPSTIRLSSWPYPQSIKLA
jgi:hypothetical protein